MSEVSGDSRDVLDVLVADHGRIRYLLRQVEGPVDTARRRDLAAAVIAEVKRHSAIEAHVYAVIERYLPEGARERLDGAWVDRDERERSIVVAMDRMATLDVADPEFFEWVSHLEQLFRDHAHDLEDEVFPMWRASVPASELTALRKSVAARLEPTGARARRVDQDPAMPSVASAPEGTSPTKVSA